MQEHAKVTTNDSIRAYYNRTVGTPTTPTNLDYTITLPKTTALISKVKRRKAPGLDQTTTDMLKAAPCSTARHVHPLLLKVTLSGQQPLIWKHGTAIPLHKGQGNTSKAGGYRSILLASEIPKLHYTFLRQSLTDLLTTALRPTQCGGLPGRSTSYAVQFAALTTEQLAKKMSQQSDTI